MVASKGKGMGLRGKSKTHGKKGGAREHVPQHGGHGTRGSSKAHRMGRK